MEHLGNVVSLTLPGRTSNASPARNNLCSESQAAKAALAIFGSFRRNDADDPEVFYAAVKRIFTAYPERLVIELADPLTGIAGKQTFLPSPAELKAELDRRMAPIWAAEDRARRERERQRRDDEGMTPEEHARAVERWERDKAEVFGKVRRTREEIAAEAEERLSELARQIGSPVEISPRLQAKLAAMREERGAQPPPGARPTSAQPGRM